MSNPVSERRPLSGLLLSVLLAATLPFPPAAHPGPAKDVQWHAVLFDGVKVGHSRSERSVAGTTVTTREFMALEIRRSGEPVRMESETVYIESVDGQPEAFSGVMRASSMQMEVEGKVLDGVAKVRLVNAGQSHTQEVPLGAALLGEGVRLAILRAGLSAGTQSAAELFEPLSMQAVRVQTTVHGPRRVEVYDRDLDLIEVEQTAHYPGNPITVRAWVDHEFRPLRSSMNLLGMKIELVACGRRCALRPNQPLDYLQSLLLRAPQALPAAWAKHGVRYTLRRRDGGALELPTTGEQQAQVHNAGSGSKEALQLDVCARCGVAGADPETLQAARQPSPWLQSDHPELRALLPAADPQASAGQRMLQLETTVREYVRTKDLSVGYASALETVRTRSGDCTEHALLLAALARADGIPARVVTGFAYIDRYAGQNQVFVPHAWTQAYVDGRWQSFDAALQGFSAGHIALGIGDGDPSRFHAGMSLLGELEVHTVQRLPGSHP